MAISRSRKIRPVDAALLGGIAAVLTFIANPADARILVTMAASFERPGLDENARIRAEANAQKARQRCMIEMSDDRVALSTCVANARAAAYRDQQAKADKETAKNRPPRR